MEKTEYLDLLAKYGINSAHPGGFLLTKKLLRNEKLTPNIVLLDVGCGTGQTSVFIAKNYPCKVVAVDINPEMLEKARRKFAQFNLSITLIHANAMDLPFRKNSFDFVLVESVTIFTNIGKTLRELFRVLKPGGILLVIEATALQPLTKDEAKDFQSVLGTSYIPTMPEWRQMFRDAGFKDIQVIHQQKMRLIPSFSLSFVFREYFNTLFRCRNKIGFGVYRCQL